MKYLSSVYCRYFKSLNNKKPSDDIRWKVFFFAFAKFSGINVSQRLQRLTAFIPENLSTIPKYALNADSGFYPVRRCKRRKENSVEMTDILASKFICWSSFNIGFRSILRFVTFVQRNIFIFFSFHKL
jgi:hypothetical protein